MAGDGIGNWTRALPIFNQCVSNSRMAGDGVGNWTRALPIFNTEPTNALAIHGWQVTELEIGVGVVLCLYLTRN